MVGVRVVSRSLLVSPTALVISEYLRGFTVGPIPDALILGEFRETKG